MTDSSQSESELTKLDVSENPNQIELDCSENYLKELNISKNPELHILCCEENNITALDISANPYLVEVYKYKYGIPDLTTTYISLTYQPDEDKDENGTTTYRLYFDMGVNVTYK